MTASSNTTARLMSAARSKTWVQTLARVAGVLLVATALCCGRVQAADADAAQAVRSFYQVVLSTMRDGPNLGAKGRYERLAPAIDQTFDLAFMTRTAVGPQWYKLSDAEHQALIKAFRRYVVATYADNFDDYSGESLVVDGEQPVRTDRVVETKIVKSDGTPVAVNYLMHDDGTSWRIRDVYLEGQISELAVRRSQFISILSAQGTDGLIAMLNQKASKLVPDIGS
jgi:phospholipid transport system substrate-binding protein